MKCVSLFCCALNPSTCLQPTGGPKKCVLQATGGSFGVSGKQVPSTKLFKKWLVFGIGVFLEILQDRPDILAEWGLIENPCAIEMMFKAV
jgi:hypothetical protein